MHPIRQRGVPRRGVDRCTSWFLGVRCRLRHRHAGSCQWWSADGKVEWRTPAWTAS